MKIKVLFPVERLGLIEYIVDENVQNFYQVTYQALQQYNIDIHKCVLKDRFNKDYSPVKTFREQNIHPGTTLELQIAPTVDETNTKVVLKEQEKMFIKIKLNLQFCDRLPLILDTSIYATVESLLRSHNIQIPDGLSVNFNQKSFDPLQTLAEIGISKNAQLFFELPKPLEAENEAPEQRSAEVSRLPVEESSLVTQEVDGSILTTTDMAYFRQQQKQWELETGKGQMLTPEQRQQLKMQRAARKGVLRVRAVSGQLLLTVLELPALSATTDTLFQNLGMFLVQKFAQVFGEEQLAQLVTGGFRLRRGRFGAPIFADGFKLFDLFNEADATVDVEFESQQVVEVASQLFPRQIVKCVPNEQVDETVQEAGKINDNQQPVQTQIEVDQYAASRVAPDVNKPVAADQVIAEQKPEEERKHELEVKKEVPKPSFVGAGRRL